MSLAAYTITEPYRSGSEVPLGAYLTLPKSSPLGHFAERTVGFCLDPEGRCATLFLTHLDAAVKEEHERASELASSHPPLTEYRWKQFALPISKESVPPDTWKYLLRFTTLINKWFKEQREKSVKPLLPAMEGLPFFFSYSFEETLCRNFLRFLKQLPYPRPLEDALCYAFASNDGELLEFVFKERRTLSQVIEALRHLMGSHVAALGTLVKALHFAAKYGHDEEVLRLFYLHDDNRNRVVAEAIGLTKRLEEAAEPAIHAIYTSLRPTQRLPFQESFPRFAMTQQISYHEVERLLKLFVRWNNLATPPQAPLPPPIPTGYRSPQLDLGSVE